MVCEKVLVHFEDEVPVLRLVDRVCSGFSGVRIVSAGRSLSVDVDQVIAEVGGLEKVSVLLTDGDLLDGTKGWSAVEAFRSRGYVGPAVYFGAAKLPDDRVGLYTHIPGKQKGPAVLARTLSEYLGVVEHEADEGDAYSFDAYGNVVFGKGSG